MKNGKALRGALRILALLTIMMSLFGCFGGTKYRVDYGGYDADFFDAKDSYRAGQKVSLTVWLATDTDYSLSVDGEGIQPEVTDRGSKLRYTFTMPEHDVKVEFRQRNSMVNLTDGGNTVPGGAVDTEKTLLADYYSAPVAVVGESIYHEITLNRGSDGLLYLNVYEGSRDKGITTSHEAYRVSDDSVAQKIRDTAAEYEMETWNDVPGVGLTGAIEVCKFTDAGGELIRVSTEHMPDGGEKAISAFREVLYAALELAEPVELMKQAEQPEQTGFSGMVLPSQPAE